MISCAIGAVMKIELYERWLIFTRRGALYNICDHIEKQLFQDIFDVISRWDSSTSKLSQNSESDVGTSDNLSLIIVREYSESNFIVCVKCATSRNYCYHYYCGFQTYHNESQCTLLWSKGVTMNFIISTSDSRIFLLPLYFAKILDDK